MTILFRGSRVPQIVPRNIKLDGNSVTLTGTVAETIMGYVNVPAGMGNHGCVELDTLWEPSGGAGNWVFHLRVIAGTLAGTLAGTRLINSTVGNTGSRVRMNQSVVNLGASNLQTCLPTSAAFGLTAGTLVLGAIDTSSPWTISLNAALVNSADTVVLRHLRAAFNPSSP